MPITITIPITVISERLPWPCAFNENVSDNDKDNASDGDSDSEDENESDRSEKGEGIIKSSKSR